MNFNYLEKSIPNHVQKTLHTLNSYESMSDAALCGGALRDLYLGGVVNDWDIFCVVRSGDKRTIENIFYLLLSEGFDLQHSHGSGYVEGSDGFIADFRRGDINFILYSSTGYYSVEALVSDFDLNLNAWMYQPYDPDDRIVNVVGWDKTKPVEVMNKLKDMRANRRIPRFVQKYPELDWSAVANA